METTTVRLPPGFGADLLEAIWQDDPAWLLSLLLLYGVPTAKKKADGVDDGQRHDLNLNVDLACEVVREKRFDAMGRVMVGPASSSDWRLPPMQQVVNDAVVVEMSRHDDAAATTTTLVCPAIVRDKSRPYLSEEKPMCVFSEVTFLGEEWGREDATNRGFCELVPGETLFQFASRIHHQPRGRRNHHKILHLLVDFGASPSAAAPPPLKVALLDYDNLLRERERWLVEQICEVGGIIVEPNQPTAVQQLLPDWLPETMLPFYRRELGKWRTELRRLRTDTTRLL